ncbi:MAG: transcriptional regulator with XRE-family HTH domain [Verrucomicrobiales bacterium]|jgi:transcriptional regulator with XRE-family HTH domain
MATKDHKKQKHFCLKILRDELKLTQPEFAELVGLGAQTVTMIEAGTRKLSLDSAEKIMLVTGVNPISLIDGRFPEEIWSGREYSEASYEFWNDRTSVDFEKFADLLNEMEQEWQSLLGKPRAAVMVYLAVKSVTNLRHSDR